MRALAPRPHPPGVGQRAGPGQVVGQAEGGAAGLAVVAGRRQLLQQADGLPGGLRRPVEGRQAVAHQVAFDAVRAVDPGQVGVEPGEPGRGRAAQVGQHRRRVAVEHLGGPRVLAAQGRGHPVERRHLGGSRPLASRATTPRVWAAEASSRR